MLNLGILGRTPLEIEGNTQRRHVLLAEDDQRMRLLMATTLRRAGLDVTEVRDGAELLDHLRNFHLNSIDGHPIDLVIIDINMPTTTGLNVVTEIRWDDWAIPAILITACGDEDTHAEGQRLGAAAVLNKPSKIDSLCKAAMHFTAAGGAVNQVESHPGSRTPRENPMCSSCDYDLSASEVEQMLGPLCQECRSPLRFLEYPEHYCDLGGSG